MIRTADAEWKGNLKEGSGTMKLGSGAYEGQYSFKSRFENGAGTNPEELIARGARRLLHDGAVERARHRRPHRSSARTRPPRSTSAATTKGR